MESVLLALAVLACPIGMGLMMWMMAKGTIGGKKGRGAADEGAHAERQLSGDVSRTGERPGGEAAAR